MELHIAQLTLDLLTSISVIHRQAIPTIQGSSHLDLLALIADLVLGVKGGAIHKQGRAIES